MTENVCLANARVVLEDRVITGSVTISQGSITAIEESGHVPADAIDFAGDFLIPGLVELHTDNLERHIEPRSNRNFRGTILAQPVDMKREIAVPAPPQLDSCCHNRRCRGFRRA